MRPIIAVLSMLIVPLAAAQDWPSRPVTLVNPFAVASAVDVVARLAAQRMTQTLGHSFLVDNRTGASGNIGATVVASGPAAAASFHRKELEKFKRAVELSGARAD